MSFRSSFSAVKPLPGSKREFPNISARVNSGLQRRNGAQSTISASAQSVPSPNRPAATRPERTKPFRASPVPATTYRQPAAFLAQRPATRPSARKSVANAKLESDKASFFRAKPVPSSTYKQPKESQRFFKKDKAKEDSHPVTIATTQNQDLPVVKADLTIDVVVDELPLSPSIARSDQHPSVITSNISTQEDDEEDEDCWGAMGDWVSDLDKTPDEEEVRKFEQLEDPVEPHVEPPVEQPATSYRLLFKLKKRQYTKPELATICEENEEEDIGPGDQHPNLTRNIPTPDTTCLEEEEDDDGWGAMGDWVSDL